MTLHTSSLHCATIITNCRIAFHVLLVLNSAGFYFSGQVLLNAEVGITNVTMDKAVPLLLANMSYERHSVHILLAFEGPQVKGHNGQSSPSLSS